MRHVVPSWLSIISSRSWNNKLLLIILTVLIIIYHCHSLRFSVAFLQNLYVFLGSEIFLLLHLSVTYGLWTSTPTNDLYVLLLLIIITVTTNWLQKYRKPTKWIGIRQSQRMDTTFWSRQAKCFLFLRGLMQWLIALKSEMVGWILNFRVACYWKA